MKEVKTPKKPLLFYYAVALLVLFLFNLLAMPWLLEHQIHEVDYNTFVSMTEKKEIGQVEISSRITASCLPPLTARPSTRPPWCPTTDWCSACWTPGSPPPARRSSRPRC